MFFFLGSKRIKPLVLAAILLSGCSDYKLSVLPEEVDPGTLAPEIEVTPLEHDFGALNADGETGDVVISISNYGNDTLILDDIYLMSGSSNFSISSIAASYLEPYESTDLIVSYDPNTYESNSDTVKIISNDEDESEVLVLLGGTGDAPVISITPEYYDFGNIFLGCDDNLLVTIGNVGNANLKVSDLEYFSSLPVDFELEEYEALYGPLPWTIAPGDIIDLFIQYTPLDIYDDSAYVEVTSNDPLDPVVESIHDGMGAYESYVTDNFEQDGDASVDILFIVDNSGSMSSNQTNLKNNFDDFMSVFVGAGVDYHVAVITTDDAGFVGDIISPLTPDPITEFGNQIDSVGYHGSPYEKGLWYSYEATSMGADAGPGSSTGFFREDARLVIVYVSDEPDFSHSTVSHGGSSTMVPSDYSSHLLSLKSSSALVTAHAVAGDYPSGCSTNGGAQFGDGYYDVVSDLGGTFMSICAADWSVTMDTLARESIAGISFLLSEDPIVDTISVEVNGTISSDWSYDASLNSIIFSVAPEDEDLVDISYAVWADCDEEDEEE